jgi:hypothetical protein
MEFTFPLKKWTASAIVLPHWQRCPLPYEAQRAPMCLALSRPCSSACTNRLPTRVRHPQPHLASCELIVGRRVAHVSSLAGQPSSSPCHRCKSLVPGALPPQMLAVQPPRPHVGWAATVLPCAGLCTSHGHTIQMVGNLFLLMFFSTTCAGDQ